MEEKTLVKIKLLAAIITVVISLVLGLYTKIMLLLVFTNPFWWWFHLALYILSWVILFPAAYFVGKEALILADQWVKAKVCESYDVTKKIHKATVKQSKKHIKKGIKVVRHVKKKLKK
jgi:hypothetical protein